MKPLRIAHLALAGLLFAAIPGSISAEEPPVREMRIVPATTGVPMGKATFTVEPMQRKDVHTFASNYRVDVSPLSFASEEGRLTITVNDEALKKLMAGQPGDFAGNADSSAGNHSVVQGTATPAQGNKDTGTLRVRINGPRGKLVFNTTYRVIR